ncbi:hypothetical protein C4742_29305 [Salmonella enterica subsp. enterica serovar Mbandaka]|nr:hypothetical protein C4742_29305 [Salmonella enterica subsp. enterica serovar Mbandaka]
MNEAVINTGKPDNHIIIRAHRFCRCGRFWRGGDWRWRGFFYQFRFQRFYAFTTGFYRQCDQLVKARIVVTSHKRFDQHRDVDAGNNFIALFIDDNAAGSIKRTASPCINEK